MKYAFLARFVTFFMFFLALTGCAAVRPTGAGTGFHLAYPILGSDAAPVQHSDAMPDRMFPAYTDPRFLDAGQSNNIPIFH